MKNEFLGYLLGDASPAKWGAMLLFAYMTAFVMVLNRVKKRDIRSDRTPDKFDWRFFVADTGGRILSTILSIPLCARFALIWVEPKYVIVGAILIGLISDQLPVLMGFVKESVLAQIMDRLGKLFRKQAVTDKKVDQVLSEVKEIKAETKTGD